MHTYCKNFLIFFAIVLLHAVWFIPFETDADQYKTVICDVRPTWIGEDCRYGECLNKFMVLLYDGYNTSYKLDDNFRFNSLPLKMNCSYYINRPGYLIPDDTYISVRTPTEKRFIAFVALCVIYYALFEYWNGD